MERRRSREARSNETSSSAAATAPSRAVAALMAPSPVNRTRPSRSTTPSATTLSLRTVRPPGPANASRSRPQVSRVIHDTRACGRCQVPSHRVGIGRADRGGDGVLLLEGEAVGAGAGDAMERDPQLE